MSNLDSKTYTKIGQGDIKNLYDELKFLEQNLVQYIIFHKNSLFQNKISDDRLLSLCMGINDDLSIVNLLIKFIFFTIRVLQDMTVQGKDSFLINLPRVMTVERP